ncbi:mannose-binding protein [Streptomyces arboris]|uniref:Mannose-binding protein n=1 Tax=Streptomyces arboris TaxID=2600619 RepID=A0A5N5ET10_9ACTN|nr:mannose-binding protein [Streptomyces arboris]KAB2591852.1 mannose-binding protein [Streptomyces arboris]
MPPEPPTPGAGSTAATARAEEPTPAPPSPTAPAEETQTSLPKAEPDPTASAAEEPEAKAPATPEAAAAPEPAATPEPGAPAEPSPPAETAKEPGEARAESAALAAAVATAPETRALTAVDRGRPRTPVLAGAVFIGAALVAIPVLLMGSANDEEPRNTGTAPVAGSADTVLNPETAPAALEDYVAVKPTPSATEQKKNTPPKAAPAPAVPAPQPGTSAPSEKPTPKASPKPKPKASPKPKPKAAPQPNWGTQTVSATSSIGVGQSWATNRIRMTMQPDGNLVVYNEQNKPIWAAMTFGENHRAIFQPDGNLVIHNGDDRAIWASKTHDFGGAQLVLRPDAKVVIVHNGKVVWST